jgi:hypothetical protein
VTNARFAPLYGLPVGLLPFDDARSTTQILALVTSGNSQWAARSGGLPSGVGVVASAARLHSTRSAAPPSLARRQHPTEADKMIELGIPSSQSFLLNRVMKLLKY